MADDESTPLMRQLARWAGVPEVYGKRMLLILEVGELPRLYVEALLGDAPAGAELQLPGTPVVVSGDFAQGLEAARGLGFPEGLPPRRDPPGLADTTTQKNREFRTFVPKPPRRGP